MRNIARMNGQMARFDARLRPHVKTNKSAEVTRLAVEGHEGGITVSTLAEARYFFDAGFRDILYAVGIVPAKLPEVAALQSDGAHMRIILDDPATAGTIADWTAGHGCRLNVSIEVDSDGHRAGLAPNDPALIETARLLHESGHIDFGGVMTHAGASYFCSSVEAIRAMAEQERRAVTEAAQALREIGIDCHEVSVGATPTALYADNLDGVTEVRPGVYMFFDLVMEGLGVCRLQDLAVSVLTTVIGRQKRHNRILTDAGALALSKDRGLADRTPERGYGLVCQAGGQIIEGLVVSDVNQEHGMISVPADTFDLAGLPVGTLLRILPNHACMTAAEHDSYFVIDGPNTAVIDRWQRCRGW